VQNAAFLLKTSFARPITKFASFAFIRGQLSDLRISAQICGEVVYDISQQHFTKENSTAGVQQLTIVSNWGDK